MRGESGDEVEVRAGVETEYFLLGSQQVKMDGEEAVKQSVGKPVIPLALEDCCLAWLVSDLEHYPPELLALLPLRLRYRLLANLPVLDLCQLEHTSVAEGVHLESIWKLKCSPWGRKGAMQQSLVEYIDLSSLSWRERYLHAVANTILNNSLEHRRTFLWESAHIIRSYFTNAQYYTVVADWLFSLKGYQFLNEGGDLQSSYDWQNLASSFLFYEAESGSSYDRLTPPRYASYKSDCSPRPSDEELITLLLRNCNFKPKCLLATSARSTVSELLLQHGGCVILKEFLSEIEELQLYIRDLLPVALFQSMFSGTSPCKLRTLQVVFQYTSSSELGEKDKKEFDKSIVRIFADVIKQQSFLETIHFSLREQLNESVLASSEFTALAASLTSFVARPQFRTLDIFLFSAPANVVADILCVFLVSPCSHQQTLKLSRLTTQPSSRQLLPAPPCPAVAMQVPDAGVEYKDLYLHQQLHVNKSYVRICKTLFAFPKIRLRFLEVGCIQTTHHHYVNTLHMAAQHPDIQVKALSIQLQSGTDPSLHDDMRTLLQIPTLTKLSLPSTVRLTNPGNTFLPILAQELPKRHHLTAIEELDLGKSNFLELTVEEVEHLFQSIFSLPHLSQLTLKMDCCVVSIQHYKLIHRLWTECSSGELLKKLVLCSVVLISKEEYANKFSVGIMSLLDSMAQNTSVVICIGQLTGVGTDMIKAKLQALTAK